MIIIIYVYPPFGTKSSVRPSTGFHVTLVESWVYRIIVYYNVLRVFDLQRLGVPLEARVKVQLNLKVEQSSIYPTSNFRSITFPIMWLEEVNIIDLCAKGVRGWEYDHCF